MATNVQGYNAGAGVTQLSNENAEYYQNAMLERLLPELNFMKYGQQKTIPKNSGALTSFRRLNNLAVSTTALTEGVTPDGVDLSISKISATVQEYGNYTKISDFISLTGLDPLLTETVQLMGQNAGQVIDAIVGSIVAAGTTVVYANGVASRLTVASKILISDILKVRRGLKSANVKPISLPNGQKGYLAFADPFVITDLMQTQEWRDQNTYVDVANRIAGIAGEMYGIYFLENPTAVLKYAGAGAGSADVYATIFIGDGAYGVPDISGSSKPDIIVIPPEVAGGPLKQWSTVGWKARLTAIRLQELAIIRLETTASL